VRVETVRDQVKKAEDEAARSASSLAASATASTDTDGLEDDDEATSTSSSKAAPAPSAFSPYTNEDLSSISTLHSEISAWLDEKTTAQKKLKAHEDPVLTIKDLEAKAAKLSDAMLELIQKKIRAPKPSSSSSKKAKTKTSKASKKNKSASSTTSTSAGEAETDAPEAEQSGPKIVRMEPGEDGEMDREEILRRVREAMGEKDKEGHDEL
jgi:hypoxia up-regulated 1